MNWARYYPWIENREGRMNLLFAIKSEEAKSFMARIIGSQHPSILSLVASRVEIINEDYIEVVYKENHLIDLIDLVKEAGK